MTLLASILLFPNTCMSKGKPLGQCTTCKTEIVEFFNEGVFRNGECDACERHRYESQPELLEALDFLLAHTLDRDLAAGNELDEHEEEARRKALAALAKADEHTT